MTKGMDSTYSQHCKNPIPHSAHDWLDLNGSEWECSGKKLEGMDETTGAELIATERRRQIEVEGWTDEHDRIEHGGWELVYAAAAYLLQGSGFVAIEGRTYHEDKPLIPTIWPWDDQYWKPSPDNRIRELVKAGALIAAEIDRLKQGGD